MSLNKVSVTLIFAGAAILSGAVKVALGQSCPTITSPQPLNSNAASDSHDDWDPQLTTDGVGNWIAVWFSSDDLGGTIGFDFDILYSRSTDNGVSWTAQAALNTNASSDNDGDRNPQLTTDGEGNWIAVWESQNDLEGTIGNDWDILFAQSSDNGISWTTPLPLNSNAASDSGWDVDPQVTTDSQGNWIAVWESRDDLGGTIGNDEDILFALSTDNGASWTTPLPLNSNAASNGAWDFNPQVTTDSQGNWIAVWESNDSLGVTIGTDFDILYSRSTDNGLSWTAQAALNSNAASDSRGDRNPQLTTDGAGNWIAVWHSYDALDGTIGFELDILFARSSDNGVSWSAPAPLNSNAAFDIHEDELPQLTTDSQGNWIAVWNSFDSLGGTIGPDSDNLFSVSTDNGASWSTLEPLNTNAASDSGYDGIIQLTTDGVGNWVAVWSSTDELGGTIWYDWDILFARFVLPDCNGNGVVDFQDIANGTSQDCQPNGIPDECESYGDVNHDSNVNLQDLLCLIDGLAGLFNCPCVSFGDLDIFPCVGGNGDLNLIDLMVMLDTLAGLPACPGPCP